MSGLFDGFTLVAAIVVGVTLAPVSVFAQQADTATQQTDPVTPDIADLEQGDPVASQDIAIAEQAALAAQTAATLRADAEAKAAAATEAVVAASEVVEISAAAAKAAAEPDAKAATIAAAEAVAAIATEALAVAAEAVTASTAATEIAVAAEAEAESLAAAAATEAAVKAVTEAALAEASNTPQDQQNAEPQTDEIELRSADGFVALKGFIVDFDDILITVRTSSGIVGIENDRIECIGAACPPELLADP